MHHIKYVRYNLKTAYYRHVHNYRYFNNFKLLTVATLTINI
jgi:hypothetical protein